MRIKMRTVGAAIHEGAGGGGVSAVLGQAHARGVAHHGQDLARAMVVVVAVVVDIALVVEKEVLLSGFQVLPWKVG